MFERLNIALRLRGRYTLLLGLGRYRKSIYVNPLGRKPPCIRGVGCKAVLLRGCGVSWGIMPTLDGLTVWAWQVLTVPGSLERNTLGWGMVWDYISTPFRVHKEIVRPGGAGLSPLPFTARGEPYLSHITARGVPSAYNRKGATPAPLGPLGAVLVLGVSLGAAGPSPFPAGLSPPCLSRRKKSGAMRPRPVYSCATNMYFSPFLHTISRISPKIHGLQSIRRIALIVA